MSKRNKIIAAAAIALALIIIISLSFLMKPTGTGTPSTNIGTTTPESSEVVDDIVREDAAPPSHPDKEITFNSKMLVQNKTLGIDGGAMEPVPCSIDYAKPTLMGFIQLDKNTKGTLRCLDNYMGGISLIYTDAKGTQQTMTLGQRDGDAGDSWDLRSWVTKDAKGISVRTISFGSTSDVEESGAATECHMKDEYFVWNEAEKDFRKGTPPAAFDISSFTLPIEIEAGCLDSQGRWKGK
jgi:hypothetical protein